MKRPRLRLLWQVPLGLVPLLPILWALIVTFMPTDWARLRVVAKLENATGRSVRLDQVRVGYLGDIRVSGLEIGAPRSAADPWLKVASAKIDVGLLQLLKGDVEPTEIDVDGLTLRIQRRPDGTLELADLLQPSQTAPAPQATSTAPASGPKGLEVHLRDAHITVIDEPSQTKLELTGVEGRASCEGPIATVHELRGLLNGGPFDLTAHLDRSTPEPAFEGQFRAKAVELGVGMNALSYLVPLLAGKSGAPGSLDGRLDADFYLKGQGITRDALQRSLVGRIAISLDPIKLDASKVVTDLANLIDLPPENRVGSIRGDFAIKDGRIGTDNLTLKVAKVPLVLTGWTGFDGRLDYQVRNDRLASRLPSKARGLLAELSIDPATLTTMKVQGTVDAIKVTVDGVPLTGGTAENDPGRRGDDRQRLRDLSKRLRDKLLR